jgi:hypothetical protein
MGVVNSDIKTRDTVLLYIAEVPGTLYVPGGSDLPNAYAGQYLCNESIDGGDFVEITAYDSEFHKIVAAIPSLWKLDHTYSIRCCLPIVRNHESKGSTTSTIVLQTEDFRPGDFIRVIETGEISKVTSSTGNVVTVSPEFKAPLPDKTIVEILAQTGDNFKTLSGISIGQKEQTTHEIQLVSGTIPNVVLSKVGGYPSDYPYLYVEFYDTNSPTQSNLFSNGYSNKSFFKVTTPTGQVLDRKEKFTKVTGDMNRKTIRFRPTSNFRIVWRLPSGQVVRFEESDSISPHFPKDHLQTSVMFNMRKV